MLLAFRNPSTWVAFQSLCEGAKTPPASHRAVSKVPGNGTVRYWWAHSPLGETALLCPSAQQRRGLSRLTGVPALQQGC